MDQLITEDPARIGPYRLVARLGAGGMGLVYLGRSDVGRTVAVKVVQAEYAQHPEFRRRFAREVAAARRVGGSWTAAVLDADTDAPVPWVATQYIPGPDLTTVVAEDFGPLPEHSVRTLAHRLATALESVHAAGLIHRDLKPSNVLVTVDGPRVIDFGIARAMDTLAGDSLHTRTGMLIGSPGFMSPEQVRGLELTPASDVFCLGAVLVYAATGRHLFGATDTGLNAHLFRIAEEEADLTGVPDSLLDLVRECLHKDPARRPTPAEVAARTATAEGGEEWLPGTVLAQLGRHAAQLLDFAPSPRAEHPPTVPAQAGPPAYTPTVPADAAPPTPPVPAPPPRGPRPWQGLGAALLAVLLVQTGFGATMIMDSALIADLGLAPGPASLVFGGYTVAFGALLLLGGHLSDLIGRRRTLTYGLIGYAVSSALTGFGSVAGILVVAQVARGASAALVSAAGLAVVAGAFTGAAQRGKALGGFAVVAVGGTTLGVLGSGALTEVLSWRMCFYALTVLALVATALARLVPDHPVRRPPRTDVPGLLLGTAGAGALAFGLPRVIYGNGPDGLAVTFVVVGAVLVAAFLAVRSRAAGALLPGPVLRSRDRVGAVLGLFFAGISSVGTWWYLYNSLDPSSRGVRGLAMLPLVAAAAIIALLVTPRLLPVVAPRRLIVPGLLAAAAGPALLTGYSDGAAYATHVLPGLVVTGAGLGLALVPLLATATGGTDQADVGGTAGITETVRDWGEGLGSTVMVGVIAATSVDHDLGSPAVMFSTTAALAVAGAVAAGMLVRAEAPVPAAARGD